MIPKNQERFYYQILENLHSATLLFDKALKLRYLNPACERLFEISARQIVGQPIDALLVNAGAIADLLRESLETGDSFTRHELTLEPTHTNSVVVDATIARITDGESGPEVLLELVEMDRILRIARDESLISQQDVTRDLLRGLAHEIKNPLGGLRGAAQLLEKQLNDEELKEYTDVIINEADRLQNLVNRMIGPRTLPETQLTNIHEVLERVRSLVASEMGNTIELRRDYDPSIPEIRADLEQLIQAVLNIVRNAAQALDNKGKIILRTRVLRKYTIGTTRYPLVIKLEIIDNGPGIPEDIRERIFYPMVTGRAEGTGLGLSIAQSLVQRHGGLIECESAPGHTVFTILLPIIDGEEKS